MQIEIHSQDDICILSIKGRLVAGTEPEEYNAQLNELKALKPTKLLVDVTEVPSMGSMGVGMLMNIYASIIKNPEGRFVLVGANFRVHQVLEVTRLSKIMSLAPDVATGMAILRSANPA